MSTVNLESTAKALVGDGKGILAADETLETLTKRFDAYSADIVVNDLAELFTGSIGQPLRTAV